MDHLNFKRSWMAGLLVVLMLGACLVPLFADDSAAGSPQTYDISMSVGDTFTYTPTVNLTGATITASGTGIVGDSSAVTGAFLTFTDGTLSGTATAAGSYAVTLTASYTGGSDAGAQVIDPWAAVAVAAVVLIAAVIVLAKVL